MKQKRINRGFTLVEIVIVLVVMSLLIGVLFKVYQRIADISVRVRYEKNLGNSIVTMQTMLQNVVDSYTVDYTAWIQQSQPWWTNTIPLLNSNKNKVSLSISTSWELLLSTNSGGQITTASLLGEDIVFKNATFILSPTTDPAKERDFSSIYQPGFRLIGSLQPKTYPSLLFPVQTFFSFLQR
jgi:prepilin-type N-terminal cleavage/methylation domain-containing protein